jgi:acetyl-CoA acetyltransferase
MTGNDDVMERQSAVSGIGQSDIGRRLGRDPLELTLEACLAAVDDAGLTLADVDGLSTYPGPMAVPRGFSGAGAYEVIDALRLEVGWYDSGVETSGQLGSVIKACLAVGAGLADHVLCFRSVWEGSAQGGGGRASLGPGAGSAGGGDGDDGAMPKASGINAWSLPFGSASPANWVAMFAQAHMHRYGTTEEQLAQIALNARRNAARNPKAIYRDPMTLEDYLGARMITTPLRLFDCDVPCDGATAVVVSRRARAAGLRHPLVAVEAVGSAMRDRPSWDQVADLTRLVGADAAAQMWSRTSLTPADVELAEIYDGFSYLTLLWLEALGLCPVGESGPFVEGGERIALGGSLPLNTQGGQLSGGRLHGYGFLHEAVVQLRGDGGERQAPGRPRVAAVAAGGGYTCGCMLLTAGG